MGTRQYCVFPLVTLSKISANVSRGRTRIDYRDLGVEQLGAVYESVLDYEVTAGPKGPALRRGGVSSGLARSLSALLDTCETAEFAPGLVPAAPSELDAYARQIDYGGCGVASDGHIT